MQTQFPFRILVAAVLIQTGFQPCWAIRKGSDSSRTVPAVQYPAGAGSHGKKGRPALDRLSFPLAGVSSLVVKALPQISNAGSPSKVIELPAAPISVPLVEPQAAGDHAGLLKSGEQGAMIAWSSVYDGSSDNKGEIPEALQSGSIKFGSGQQANPQAGQDHSSIEDDFNAAREAFHPGISAGQEAAVLVFPRVIPEPLGPPTDDELKSDVTISKLSNPEREQAVINLLKKYGAKAVRKISAGEAPPLDIYDTVFLQDAGLGRHNIYIVKEGRQKDLILVLSSHHDKVARGHGVIDNWGGTAANANLYHARTDLETVATTVHLFSAREEEGLLGTIFWLKSLSPDQLKMIKANVNVDTVGLPGVHSWENNSDEPLLKASDDAVAEENTKRSAGDKLQLTRARLDGGDSDSSAFRWRGILGMTIFSGTQEEIFDIIHSSKDTIAALFFPAYRNAYYVVLAILNFLDLHPL